MNGYKKNRVLIVDDSFFTRKILQEMLSSDPSIEIVGEAKDGEEAVREAVRLKPDIITMDYNMPKMSGAEATQMILAKVDPKPAILMISAYTKEGVEETLESLRAGAVDFIAKPGSEVINDMDKIKSDILLKIRIAVQARVVSYKELPQEVVKSMRTENATAPFKVIIIGASTGGPPMIENIFSELPADLRAAFLVVQHMPKEFTKRFAERLNKVTALTVREAQEGDTIKQGDVFLAPGDFHMEVVEAGKGLDFDTIHLTKDLPQHGLRPAIDVTLASAAKRYGKGAIGIILTGMGEDGKRGMKSIKDMGGYVIVQDPKTAVLTSMPESIIDAGLADEVLYPGKIVTKIIELAV